MSLVTETAFAEPAAALAHFERRLTFETDCSDVHEALKATLDFVLVDVRGVKLFATAHVPGAVNIPQVITFMHETDFTGPVVVEQDVADNATETPLELARRNLNFLKRAA